jgi:LmbE family N-acetylglucosaminyl deacetylase
MLVFSPHPDDGIMGCGGTIAKRVSEGFEVYMVMLTDGRHAFTHVLGISSEPSPEEVKQMRREEFIRAARLLEVSEKNLFFFDFEDGTLEKHEEEAEEKAIEIIEKHWPADVYYPFRRDCHPDHRATNRIVCNALKQLRYAGSYEYTIMHTYARFGPLMEKFLSLLRRDEVEEDVSAFLSLKEKALDEYKSGMRLISSKQEKPLHPSVKGFLKRKEIFHESK